MRNADWLLISEALAVILDHTEPLDTEHVPLEQAAGRTLAEPIISPIDHPPWDNSGMDGYAVRAADVRNAVPVTLRVLETVHAGMMPVETVVSGTATGIMTGAPIPRGADSVIRVEHTTRGADGTVVVVNDADAGRNVRFRGEDLVAGALVFSAGRLLAAADVGVLASMGCTQPLVRRKPRIAVLSTGNELVEPDRLSDVIAGTHIINSNTPAVSAALRLAGCAAAPLGIARDDMDDLRARLERGLHNDALITTAGASVGEHDLVKTALEELACETLFWRVKIRPGSPFSFGIVRRPGRAPLPVFGLPGNPVSVLVTFEILVRPALRRMLGQTAVYPAVMSGVAGEDITSPTGLVRFLRVRLEGGADGPARAYLTGPQGSGILTSVAAADALLVMPLEVERIAAGERVRLVPLGTARGSEHFELL
jgi:molybdopterin molybdotransferase